MNIETYDPGRVIVFLATYNERDNIGGLLGEIWKSVPQAHILVVDDNSPDGTGTFLQSVAATDARLSVIRRPAKLGLGTAHHLAMLLAMRRGYDTLVTMDADHSHDPRAIPALIDKLSDADFVIGSRYMPGGKSDYGGYRHAISASANAAAHLLVGIPLHEFTTSFRAFRVDRLAKVNFVKMHNVGYSFFMESVYRLNQAGLSLAEIPIHFRDRNAGVSKIPRLEIVRGVLKLMHLSISRLLRRAMPPLSQPISDKCANCGSGYLSELFPQQLKANEDGDRSYIYRCSSMGHASKPRVTKCLECGLCQVPRSEQPADLHDLYSAVVDETYLEHLGAKRKTFANAFQRLERVLPQPGRMLEIGAYCGLFMQEAHRHGWNVKGIEPSRWASDYARRTTGLDVVHGVFEEKMATLGRGYDAVVSWDVLEHVQDPRRFLRQSAEVLKPDGVLALSTIDIESWFPRLVGGAWPWIMEMHLYYFGSGSLERMFEEAGFDVIAVEPYPHYASLNYIYRKVCASIPGRLGSILAAGAPIVPKLNVPVTLGDVKLYIGRKRGEVAQQAAQ